MFGITKKTSNAMSAEIAAQLFKGSIKITPSHGEFGFFYEAHVYASSPAELLDNLVIESKLALDQARNNVLASQRSFLNKKVYVTVRYYGMKYGDEPEEHMSGSLTRLDHIVHTVAHYRIMTLAMAFIWEDGRRVIQREKLERAGKIQRQPYAEEVEEDAIKSSLLSDESVSESDLAYDARFSAVNYMDAKLPAYAA